MADVAAAAGVSAITVSRVLRTPGSVAAATRARVAAAVEALGYLPDPAASALASRRSDLIGVLIPSLTNAVFADTLTGIHEVLDATRFRVQIANTRYSVAEEERLVRLFLSQRPAGMVVTGIDQSPAARALLAGAGCPVVQVFETGPDPIDMMAGFDHAAAAGAAAAHLVAAGYRRIGFLGAREDPRSHRRLGGFRAALASAGLWSEDLVLVSGAPATVTGGCLLLAGLIAQAPGLDAVLCNNDILALGALWECQRRGIDVPGQMGIAGFNDIELMAAAVPPLTSVATPRLEIGRWAAGMLVARIAGREVAAPSVDLGFRVMARGSTARQGQGVGEGVGQGVGRGLKGV